MNQPETVYNPNDGETLAIILRDDYRNEGIQFFTPDEYSQQMAYMRHPEGHNISPHIHNHIERQIKNTQEVLIIRDGSVRVDFFDDTQNYLMSKILNKGDIIMLVSGGHGFEVLKDLSMVEIKQGPYLGMDDKVKFEAKIHELKIID